MKRQFFKAFSKMNAKLTAHRAVFPTYIKRLDRSVKPFVAYRFTSGIRISSMYAG